MSPFEIKIKEIGKALDVGFYQSALALALTIPDICGKVAYPNDAVGKRYENWFDNYVNGLDDIPEFDGRACYLLRCSYLHSGELYISKRQITKFKLHVDIAMGNHNIHNSIMRDGNNVELDIDVCDLCNTICQAALKFYNQFNDVSLFKNDLIDDVSWSGETYAQLFGQSEVV